MKARRGYLLVLAILAVGALFFAAISFANFLVNHYSTARHYADGVKADEAALAGLNEALYELKRDSGWTAGFKQTSLGESDATYSVRFDSSDPDVPRSVNNSTSALSTKGYDNQRVIPAATVHVVSVGRSGTARAVREMLVSAGGAKDYPYVAAGADGDLSFEASSTIIGDIKYGGKIEFKGAAGIEDGSVVGKEVSVDSKLTVDADRSVQALEKIDRTKKISGTSKITPYDKSLDDPLFINDNRVSNSLKAGEQGEVLPNPDPALLLKPGTYVDHGSTTKITKSFDLDGQVHYFPKGVTFEGGAKITGEGTIVVTGDNNVEFKIPLGNPKEFLKMNVIAIEGDLKEVGGNSIIFSAATRIEGLIYSHHDIKPEAKFELRGVMVAYSGSIKSKANTVLELFMPDNLPAGFEPWFGSSSSGSFSVISSW